MRSHASFERIVTKKNKFCVWDQVGDVINDAKFYGNRLRSFGDTGSPPPNVISYTLRSSPLQQCQRYRAAL